MNSMSALRNLAILGIVYTLSTPASGVAAETPAGCTNPPSNPACTMCLNQDAGGGITCDYTWPCA